MTVAAIGKFLLRLPEKNLGKGNSTTVSLKSIMLLLA